MIKIACTDRMVPGATLTEKAEKLVKWGFDGISMQVEDAIRGEETTAEILALPAKTGIRICEFSFLGDNFGLQMSKDPEIKKAAIQYYLDSIQICKQVGAVTAIGYEYKPQNPLPLFEVERKMPADIEEEYTGILELVSKNAFENGVSLVIEAINRYETKYINNLKDVRYFIDKLPQYKMGAVADTFHLAIEEKNIADSIRQSKGYIKEVHLGDNNRMLPGYGSLDWKSIIRAFKDIEYDGFLALECGIPGDPEKLLPECAEFLKKLIETV